MPRRAGGRGGAARRCARRPATGRLHRAAAGDSVRRAGHPRHAARRACRPTWFRRCWKRSRNCPRSPAAKWTARACPRPRARPAEERPDLVPPRTALEKQIVAAWEKLFAPTPVSVQDDFFLDLGGHSLLAARMVSELRKSRALPAALGAGRVSASDCREAGGALRVPGGRASPRAQTSCRIRARGDARPPGGGALLAAFLLRGRPVGQPVLHPELLRPAMAGALSHLHRADRGGLRLPRQRCSARSPASSCCTR